MKKTKKIFALLLALVMTLTMSVATFAANGTNSDNGTITINDAVPGQEYSIYQILVLESYDTDAGAYSYKAADGWNTFLSAQNTYVNVDSQGYVTWVGATDDATVAAFAKVALAYAEENNISAADTQTAPEATGGETYSTVNFTGLNLGWYLVDTSVGALCSLDTTKPDATIDEKNEVPTVEKEVVDEDGNDPSVGEDVNFKITITAQPGAESYVLHDQMSDGLELVANSVAVSVGGSELGSENNYEVNYNPTDGCDFEITFTQSYLDTISEATDIVIEYSATITEDAVIGTDPVTNKAILDYGDENEVESETTKTYVYYFDLVKTNTDNKLINGAEFKLYESEDGVTPINFVFQDGAYRVATSEDETTTDTIIVSDGMVRIIGLGAGEYYLEETKAPDGYNKLNSRVRVTVNANNAATINDGTYESGGVEVENRAGSLLPSTGGMGTTVIYILGAALVLGAGIVLVVRRRMSSDR